MAQASALIVQFLQEAGAAAVFGIPGGNRFRLAPE